MKNFLLAFLLLFSLRCFSQTETDNCLLPADPLVKQNLEQWQDMKFGIIIHWGLYSQKGILESWGLCPEDEDWMAGTASKIMMPMSAITAMHAKYLIRLILFRQSGPLQYKPVELSI